MMLKKTREEMLNQIQANVHAATYNNLAKLTWSSPVTMHDLQYAIQQAISDGVREGFKVFLDNQYSHEEFEQDIGLKD